MERKFKLSIVSWFICIIGDNFNFVLFGKLDKFLIGVLKLNNVKYIVYVYDILGMIKW